MKFKIIAIFMWATALPLTAQVAPGTEDLYRFFGPQSLGGGPSVVNGLAATGDHWNPALSGDNQRTTLDLYFTSLVNAAGNAWGNGGGIGLSLPTRFAVYNLAAWVMISRNPDFDIGSLGGIRLGLAKDIYDDFLLGLGFNAGAGGRPDGRFDWSAAASVGFVHSPYIGEALRNFRWGIALRDLGKPFTPLPEASAVPAVVTPALGTAFDLLPPGPFQLQVGGDVSFPFVQNLVADLNAQLFFQIGEDWGFGLRSAFVFDVRDFLETGTRKASLLPSVGFFVTSVATLDTEDPNLSFLDPAHRKSDFRPSVAWSALRRESHAFSLGANIALGSIDKEPPVILIDPPALIPFSPNADGVQDEMALPWEIQDQRFVREWRMEIKNEEGTVVRTIRNKDDRPENQGLFSFFDRLLYEKKGVAVPESVRWDGRSDAGETLVDGVYSVVLHATDDNGNHVQRESFLVALDNTRPSINLPPMTEEDKIFSPDGDGRRDGISFRFTGSHEKEWLVTVTNSAGETVRQIKQENSPLQSVEWNGQDNQGNLVPDGVYSLTVASTDPSGNINQETVRNIILNTQITPIELNLSYAHFSPNGDGVRDTIEFTPEIPVTEGIRTWSFDILIGTNVVRSFQGENVAPGRLRWDGTNEAKTAAGEGLYTAVLRLQYVKGNAPEAKTGTFRLDRTAPNASVTIDGAPTFSPGGEGARAGLPLLQRAVQPDPEDNWTASVIAGTPSNPGRSVRTQDWSGRLPENFVWDGTDSSGRVVNDDTYFYQLEGKDPSGNTFVTRSPPFTVDTRARSLLVSVESDFFSPNGDRAKDGLVLFPRLNIAEGVGTWSLQVLNGVGSVVRTIMGSRSIPASLVWDGNIDGGTRAPEGQYSLRMQVSLLNGQNLTALVPSVTLDITPPNARTDVVVGVFSPDGDGKKDQASFRTLSSSEVEWRADVGSAGTVLRTLTWQGQVSAEWGWDGRDGEGNLVPDGAFTLTLSATDRAGNTFASQIPNIRSDRRPVQLFVTSSASVAPLGRAGPSGEIRWGLTAVPMDGISTWKLEIVNVATQGVVRVLEGQGVPPASVTWRPTEDAPVPDGRYIARFSSVYVKGNEPEVVSAPVIVDTRAPVLEISSTPALFSPDNDGFQDELTLSVKSEDLSGVSVWRLQALDPTGVVFHEWRGQGAPASTILWDGRGKDGELVQAASDYDFVLTASDQVGLETTVKHRVTTDILVIREGNRLRIAIPSIVFQGNSPLLLADNSPEAHRNVRLLRRLAEVLNRFHTHRITIEGHAASLQFTNPVAYEREETETLGPLSLRRSETVRDELARGGVDRGRMRVEGVGGRRPAVPHSDIANRWKNRRVVFYLDR